MAPIVRNASFMYKAATRVLGQTLPDTVIRASFFKHFCGGENESDLVPVMQRLSANGEESWKFQCFFLAIKRERVNPNGDILNVLHDLLLQEWVQYWTTLPRYSYIFCLGSCTY